MSFVFRPSPVVVLSGWDPAGEVYYPFGLPVADPKTRWYGYGFKGDTTYPARGGTMQGYTRNMASPALNAIGRRTIGGSPWLISSGTMGRFLGQDDGSGLDLSNIDFSGDGGGDFGGPPIDYSGAFEGPNLPPVSMIGPAAPVAPDLGMPSFSPSTSLISTIGPTPPPPAPVAQAPGFQAAAVSGGASIFSSIANFFKPTVKPTPMTAAMPGVYKATTVTPSWFAQSSLLPGVPNTTALIGGVIVLVLFASLGSKK